MKPERNHIFAAAAAILFAAAGLALFSGCKGNPTSAATGEKHVGPPPQIGISRAPADPRALNPMTDPVWKNAPWYTLAAPANTDRTTPEVRAAMLYDAQNLYVAFISKTVPPLNSPITQDFVSVYLDSSAAANGTEMARISVSSKGAVAFDDFRSEVPALPSPTGGPETTHAYRQIPRSIPQSQIAAAMFTTTEKSNLVWATVITIPMDKLPPELASTPAPGKTWKINLIRSITTETANSNQEQFQANLSPVYVNAQPVSPYRLSQLTLLGQ